LPFEKAPPLGVDRHFVGCSEGPLARFGRDLPSAGEPTHVLRRLRHDLVRRTRMLHRADCTRRIKLDFRVSGQLDAYTAKLAERGIIERMPNLDASAQVSLRTTRCYGNQSYLVLGGEANFESQLDVLVTFWSDQPRDHHRAESPVVKTIRRSLRAECKRFHVKLATGPDMVKVFGDEEAFG